MSESTPWQVTCENYAQTLIAPPGSSQPVGTQIEQFFAQMVALSVIPQPMSIHGLCWSGKTRTIVNPFDLKPMEVEVSDRLPLATTDEISQKTAGMQDFRVQASGCGRPGTPPLVIDFDEPYYVTVACRLSSVLRCTSDDQGPTTSDSTAVPFGRPCTADDSLGRFTNPWTGEQVIVEGAGCARFWIEFELGKFLIPKIENGNLAILNPQISSAASQIFGVDFVQGCRWG